MKNTILIMIMSLAMLSIGCEEDVKEGPNELSGETNIPLTKVGNEYNITIRVNDTYLDFALDTAYISKNDNGKVTVKVIADISKLDPAIRAIIPARFLDEKGNIDGEFYFKVTSEGIQEYYYSDGDHTKPFTIVKYDMNVGDSWSYTTSDGKTINRAVTEKTGQDDWPLGLYLIKTIKTEESNPGIDGISKVTFRSNHRFGLVYVEYTLTTGSTIKISLFPLADL